MDYAKLQALFAKARKPYAGKPIANNTRIHGGYDSVLAIRHHSTDILRYHPDGAVEICTGWTTVSTMARLRAYSNSWIYSHQFTAVNGFRHDIKSSLVIRCDTGKWYPFRGTSGYIKIDKNGIIDPTTVEPLIAEMVADPQAVRAARKACGVLKRHHSLRVKLGQKFSGQTHYSNYWLRSNLSKPLDAVDWAGAPEKLDIDFPLIELAQMLGMTKELIIKEVECPRWS